MGQQKGATMRVLKTVGLFLALALTCGAAGAAPIEDPEATVVEALVVQAVEPGPAWWRVSDGDSIVYILGAPESPMPPGVTWDNQSMHYEASAGPALNRLDIYTEQLGNIRLPVEAAEHLRCRASRSGRLYLPVPV